MPTNSSSRKAPAPAFVFDGLARPENTVARPEAAQLLAMVGDGQRVYVDAPRRVGKTTLVINTIEGAGRPVIRVDLEGVQTINALTERIKADVKAFLAEHPKEWERIESKVHTTAGVGANLGVFSFSLGGTKEGPSRMIDPSLDGILSAMVEVARMTRAVVFIDEFQSVKSEALLHPAEIMGSFSSASDPARTRGEVPFVFAGSNRHAMRQIFAGSESQFYQRTQNLQLSNIPAERINPFLAERLGRPIDPKLAADLYDWAEGIPGDLQRLYSTIHRMGDGRKDPVTLAEVSAAKEAAVSDIGRSYSLTLQKLDPLQLRLLDLIARCNIRSVSQLATAARQSNADLSKLNAALEGVLKLGILHVGGGRERIDRPEPLLFHFLAAHPAIEHRPHSCLLGDANDAVVDNVISNLERELLHPKGKEDRPSL